MKDSLQYLELEAKMEAMKKKHEADKKTGQKLCMDYAVNYYKKKTSDLGLLYSQETVKLLQQYNQLRQLTLTKDKMLTKTLNYVIEQEQIVNELRTFIEVYLFEMLDFVEREQAGVCQKYLQEVGQVLPEQLEQDPFAIFTLYKSSVSSRKRNGATDDLREEIEFLQEQLRYKDQELQALHLAANRDAKETLA